MDKPVFVDASGRRLTALRVTGRVAGGLFATYLVLVGVSLVAPPGLDKLEVPGVGGVLPAQRAPEVVTSDGDETKASDAVEEARRSKAGPVTGGSTGASSGGRPAGTPRPTPRVGSSPAPSPAKGRPTAPPGQATPVPGATPTPKPGNSTGKPTAKPQTSKPQTSKPQTNKPTAKPTNGRQNVEATALPALDGGTP